MLCRNCGNKISDNNKFCPECGCKVDEIPTVEATQVDKDGREIFKNGIKKPSKNSKNFAAIVTALLVFPGSILTAIDLSFHKYDFWFGYVVGFLFVIWVCAVLPVLKITPPPATAAICFFSIVGYAFFIMKKTGHLMWLYQRILPLFLLFALLLAIDVALIGGDRLKGCGAAALVSFEIGCYIIAIELTGTGSLTNLHWSPILACGFISIAAVFLAFAYIFKRKD